MRTCRRRMGSVRMTAGMGPSLRISREIFFFEGADAHEGGDVGEDAAGGAEDHFDLGFSGFDFGEIEDVVDDGEEVLAVAADGVDVFEAVALGLVGIEHEIGVADDGGHGGADFVAHVGEEAGFGGVGFIGGGACGGEFAVEAMAGGEFAADDPGGAADEAEGEEAAECDDDEGDVFAAAGLEGAAGPGGCFRCRAWR